jgi:hypothetical protein
MGTEIPRQFVGGARSFLSIRGSSVLSGVELETVGGPEGLRSGASALSAPVQLAASDSTTGRTV